MENKEPPCKFQKMDDTNILETLEAATPTKTDDVIRWKRKKFGLMVVYSGNGYYGVQFNPPFKTIEADLMEALVKAELVKEDVKKELYRIKFQRASRTDKGVSAACQLFSLQLRVDGPKEIVPAINEHLAPHIRAIAATIVTKNFDSKEWAKSRTYSYLLPTYALTPINEFILQSYRVTDEIIEHANKLLKLYLGTHNFHNFTSGKKSSDQSARRYIMSMECGRPFIREGIEFVIITVKGQSFMLHQIRKMIGLVIAIVRGFASDSSIENAYKADKMDIPRAPGLGLMLEKIHYDDYNKKFCSKGEREPLEWSKYSDVIDEFKEKFIIGEMVSSEVKDHGFVRIAFSIAAIAPNTSMMTWLSTLSNHTFDIRSTESYKCETGYALAHQTVERLHQTDIASLVPNPPKHIMPISAKPLGEVITERGNITAEQDPTDDATVTSLTFSERKHDESVTSEQASDKDSIETLAIDAQTCTEAKLTNG